MTDKRAGNPLLRPGSILLAALALSIGWGMRGNFGHEYGAMVPGALAAIAVRVLSGREDWRSRVAFFGFFGALGWGFGGSISFMQVISYTHSGQFATQLYGFAGLFLIGFLWAGMGGAGTALPAVWDRDRLTELFRPLLWIFGFWILLHFFAAAVNEALPAMQRHEGPLYWHDSDWLPAVFALMAVLAFDFWDRRFEGSRFWLLLGAIGAAAGTVLHGLFWLTGLHKPIAGLFVRTVGLDRTYWDAVIDFVAARFNHTPLPYPIVSDEVRAVEYTLINWPQFLAGWTDHPGYYLLLGGVIGFVIGTGLYFAVFGNFRSGSALLLYMAIGWLAGFILLTAILGLRLTPPRGDNWSGILGVFIAVMLYMIRYNWKQIAFTSIVAGTIGGVAFSSAAWLKLMMVSIGNPRLGDAPAWTHYQSANWHSFLGQTHGFINGLAIVIAMALLLPRQPHLLDWRRMRRWTEIFAVVFVVLGLTYLNLSKNPVVWINAGLVQNTLTAPLIGHIETDSESWIRFLVISAACALQWGIDRTDDGRIVVEAAYSAHTWFALVYVALAVVMVWALRRHLREPLAVMPASPLGKGQLLFLVLLWAMVIGNFERALPGFHHSRLLTEWVIFMNAALATLLVLILPRTVDTVPAKTVRSFAPHIALATALLLVVWAFAAGVQTATVRAVYGDTFAGHAGRDGNPQLRFGSEAEWRIAPLRSGDTHR